MIRLIAMLLLLGAGAARAADAPWFSIAGPQAGRWVITPVDGDPMHLAVTPGGSVKPARHRILVLYPRASSAYDVAIGAILGQFAEQLPDVALDVVNYGNADKPGLAALAAGEARGDQLVFAMGSEAAALVVNGYSGGRLPVVTVCAKDPVLLGQTSRYDAGAGKNIAFTSLNQPINDQLAYLLRLKPELKAIGILVDSKNISAVQTQSEPLAAAAAKRGITVVPAVVDNPGAAEAELMRVVPAAMAAMRKIDPDLRQSVFWMTGSTALFGPMATINRLAGSVPVISVVPELVKEGPASATLSIGISFESNAQLAGLYAIEILGGRARAGDLPVGVVSPPDLAINFERARALGLKIPIEMVEAASLVYAPDGRPARVKGQLVRTAAATP